MPEETIDASRLVGANLVRNSDDARFTITGLASPTKGKYKERLFFRVIPERSEYEIAEFIEWNLVSRDFSIVALRPIDSDLSL